MTTIKSTISLLIFFLCLAGSGRTQVASLVSAQQRFDNFNQLLVQEKLYLHTDKNFYIAGEIVWFRIFYIDGNTDHSVSLSKVAYVEIMDKAGKPALQAKIAIDGNGGNGSLYLPLTLGSGSYTLRAYTSWMRNFDPAFFFEKRINIVNTIKATASSVQEDTVKTQVKFFPEGGYLVSDIETKIGFRIADNAKGGLNAKGVVTDNTGDTILSFSPYRLGIGSFAFTPHAGRSYIATITTSEGRIFQQALPEIKQYGYVLNVADNNDGRLRVKIRARKNDVSTEELTLLVHTRQSVKVAEHGFIDGSKELIFFIEKSKLAEGVSYFTLFDKNQQPVCERLVFTRPRQKHTASINPDKNAYAARQRVDLSVGAEDSINCSVSIFQIDSLQDLQQGNIASYLLLTADLAGEIESPGYYLSDETGTEEATDNLMLTYGWRRFRWENVLAASPKDNIKFLPEYRGHIIYGRVINNRTGNLVADADCFLSVPSSPFGLYMARSDKNGIARFDVKDYYGPNEIIAQVSEKDKKQYRIDLMSPFASEAPASNLPVFSISKDKENELLRKSIGMQSQNIYAADSIRRYISPVQSDTLPFFGKAEFSYLLDDYKRFTTMEEVLREYVTRVNVVLRNGKLYLSVFDEQTQQIYHDGVMLLLDGVLLNDYNAIFSYDPLKVKKLDVIPRRYIFGSRVFSGVLSFETQDGKFNAFDLDPDLIAVDYEGLQLQREFYSPDYVGSNKQSRIPDLRSTLHWQPELVVDSKEKKTIHFYTSDLHGKFIAVLEGINKKGEPFYTTATFTVE
jgi:hypothetical protein